MRVLVLGVRGLPQVAGGVETHAEHLYARLAQRGCDVEVVVRPEATHWGTRWFVVADPDGNLIAYNQRRDAPEA